MYKKVEERKNMTDELLVINNEENIEKRIAVCRGVQVMLDSDVAELFGVDTGQLNRQMKRNLSRFPKDFCFQPSNLELKDILRCQNGTSNSLSSKRRYVPYVYTEQGIYMVISVLKGELAIKQSKAIIRTFKMMKDYIIETSGHLLTNTNQYIESRFSTIDARFEVVESKLDVVMDNFIDPSTYKHFLILDGERIESDIAYQQIYSLAKKSIIIIDDYISIKTLELLKVCDKSISIIICSDNVARNNITEEQLEDFKNDTGLLVEIKPTNNRVHDRYIVIDYQTDNEILYHSGASSKDSGNRITTIMRIENTIDYHRLIDELLNN